MTVISGELYDPVVVEECKVKHYNSKVDIKLKKKEQFNWNELLKGDLIDAFQTSGTGFGSTFDFKYFPVRIDFILADQSFLSRNFKNYTIPYSDHFPILSEFSLHK